MATASKKNTTVSKNVVKTKKKSIKKIGDCFMPIDRKKTSQNETKKRIKNNLKEISTKKRLPIYYDYYFRLTITIILFVTFFGLSIFTASKTLDREKLSPVLYGQKGNINYKVYLNENDFYEKDYLGMNRAYIASLINHIDMDFNYIFSIDVPTSMKFDYKIIGELVIENNDGTKQYFEKKYDIVKTKTSELNNSNSIKIDEKIQLDYDYYNRLANSFKSTYGVEVNSYLNVYMEVTGVTKGNLNYNISETNKIIAKVPLSQKAIEITIDTKNNEETKSVVPVGKVIFKYQYLVIEIMYFLLASIFVARIINYISVFFKASSAYDRYVNKLLKEYDRLIVTVHTTIKISEYNVIKVNTFSELLDVRDNLKVPIIYYNVVKHQKGYFYIKDGKDLFLLKIKNVDLL